MSVQITFTIAGPDAGKLKARIEEEARSKGGSTSEWLTEAAVEKLRKENGKND